MDALSEGRKLQGGLPEANGAAEDARACVYGRMAVDEDGWMEGGGGGGALVDMDIAVMLSVVVHSVQRHSLHVRRHKLAVVLELAAQSRADETTSDPKRESERPEREAGVGIAAAADRQHRRARREQPLVLPHACASGMASLRSGTALMTGAQASPSASQRQRS